MRKYVCTVCSVYAHVPMGMHIYVEATGQCKVSSSLVAPSIIIF